MQTEDMAMYRNISNRLNWCKVLHVLDGKKTGLLSLDDIGNELVSHKIVERTFLDSSNNC